MKFSGNHRKTRSSFHCWWMLWSSGLSKSPSVENHRTLLPKAISKFDTELSESLFPERFTSCVQTRLLNKKHMWVIVCHLSPGQSQVFLFLRLHTVSLGARRMKLKTDCNGEFLSWWPENPLKEMLGKQFLVLFGTCLGPIWDYQRLCSLHSTAILWRWPHLQAVAIEAVCLGNRSTLVSVSCFHPQISKDFFWKSFPCGTWQVVVFYNKWYHMSMFHWCYTWI